MTTLTPERSYRTPARQFQDSTRAAKQLFLEALEDTRAAQAAVLDDLRGLTARATAWQGSGTDLSSLTSLRRTVPIRDYAAFEPSIEEETLAKGGVLSGSPVLRWLKTSGTTGNPKRIPYTQHWMRYYRVPAIRAMWDTYLAACPQLLLHEHATLDTQSIREDVGRTVHGLPHQAISNRHPCIDSEDWNPPWYDAPWYGPHVPATHDGRMYIRLRHFLGRDLRGLTAINPSMILSLRDQLKTDTEPLLRDLFDGTIHGTASDLPPMTAEARRLHAVLNNDDFTLRDVWPRLAFYSCWSNAGAAQYLARLQQALPRSTFVPFMTCGTEGVVTIPVSPEVDAQPLAINQAVFEFVPLQEDPATWVGTACETTLQPHELEAGQRYHLVMSQGNGLMRLWTGDIFEVVEMRHGAPWLAFVERHGIFHSFTGEKLSHADVATAFEQTYRVLEGGSHPYMIGPEWGAVPRYVALVESGTGKCARDYEKRLDEELMAANLEYAAKRTSGRLGAPLVRVCPPDSVRALFERQRAAGNQNQHKFKPHQPDAGFFHDMTTVS